MIVTQRYLVFLVKRFGARLGFAMGVRPNLRQDWSPDLSLDCILSVTPKPSARQKKKIYIHYTFTESVTQFEFHVFLRVHWLSCDAPRFFLYLRDLRCAGS